MNCLLSEINVIYCGVLVCVCVLNCMLNNEITKILVLPANFHILLLTISVFSLKNLRFSRSSLFFLLLFVCFLRKSHILDQLLGLGTCFPGWPSAFEYPWPCVGIVMFTYCSCNRLALEILPSRPFFELTVLSDQRRLVNC